MAIEIFFETHSLTVDNDEAGPPAGCPASYRRGAGRWDGQRVLVIGHVATRWGLDHHINGVTLEDLAGQDFAWREGWEYRLR